MTTERLLQQAKAILDGLPATSPRLIRVAAFLIRQALEAEVDAFCEDLVMPMRHPVRMRSRLAVLHALDRSGLAATAEYAWIALSRACHHHAYELAPTVSELRHLHAVVAEMAAKRARILARDAH
ncbi:hypothetical protein [Kribbella sp. VKM Ac-2568]|uniref:hypothetical protein n=1 Tax=Kribbella sp. VKM Ac-2568 TaxID=2512219 RepID=UPI001049193D|nr:hypothetical protein [Kribbella sp. VKM Ac-2568]TCM51298.1 hypothetical protein EV648_101125 [Kribbella sp. VKM Ac-2568]